MYLHVVRIFCCCVFFFLLILFFSFFNFFIFLDIGLCWRKWTRLLQSCEGTVFVVFPLYRSSCRIDCIMFLYLLETSQNSIFYKHLHPKYCKMRFMSYSSCVLCVGFNHFFSYILYLYYFYIHFLTLHLKVVHFPHSQINYFSSLCS